MNEQTEIIATGNWHTTLLRSGSAPDCAYTKILYYCIEFRRSLGA